MGKVFKYYKLTIHMEEFLESYYKEKRKSSSPLNISSKFLLTSSELDDIIKSHRIVDIRDFDVSSLVEGIKEGTKEILSNAKKALVTELTNYGLSVVDNWLGDVVRKVAQFQRSWNKLNDYLNTDPFRKALEGVKNTILETHIEWNLKDNTKNKKVKINPSIYDMLEAGPNLYSNMYDINLVYYNKTNDTYVREDTQNIGNLRNLNLPNINGGIINENQKLQDFLDFSGMLTLRNVSISFPLSSYDTYKVSFLNREIEKVNSSISETNKAKMSLDMDFNLHILDLFLNISGLKQLGYHNDSLNGYYINVPDLNTLHSKRIDLVINIHSLSPYGNMFFSKYSQGMECPIAYIIFEDVKFMGTSSGVNFKRDSVSTQQMEVNFIYKRVKTLYSTDINPSKLTPAVSPQIKTNYSLPENTNNIYAKNSAVLEDSNLTTVSTYNFNIDWGI